MRRRSHVTSLPPKQFAWAVVYIDMMTNMMIFFVVLWAINHGQETKVGAVGDVSRRFVTLPADVLFGSGSAQMTSEGKSVFQRLFKDESGSVLNFQTSGLMKRILVVHGHTDSDGKKENNLVLGFRRALSAYEEIARYSKQVREHVSICSHADNTPAQEVPKFSGKLTKSQGSLLNEAKKKNRRITIEDMMVNRFEGEK